MKKPDRIIKSLNKKGYIDVRIAEMAGITQSYVSHLKKCRKVSPSLQVYFRLLKLDDELPKKG